MKIEIIKHILKSLDKKNLRKICFELLQIINDFEIENFCLKEKNAEIKSRSIMERMRADAAEIRSESSERMLLMIINDIEERFGSLGKSQKREGLSDEKNNFKETETC